MSYDNIINFRFKSNKIRILIITNKRSNNFSNIISNEKLYNKLSLFTAPEINNINIFVLIYL